MTWKEECALSYYKEIAVLSEKHRVSLVMHVENHKLYVKKQLKVFDRAVYEYVKDHHPFRLPKIVEMVEEGNTLILIEDYIQGDTLREILDKEGVLSEERAADVIMQLCGILAPLHAAGIVHRDIKPENIILTRDKTLYLIDLNIAVFASEKDQQDTGMLGTRGYAAPEQHGLGFSTPRTDIYGLGVLLHVLLTGKTPEGRIEAGRFSSLIEVCVRPDQRERYASVQTLMGELFMALS